MRYGAERLVGIFRRAPHKRDGVAYHLARDTSIKGERDDEN